MNIKSHTTVNKTTHKTCDNVSYQSHPSSVGNNALALTPPDYGINFVDISMTAPVPVQRVGKLEEERPLQARSISAVPVQQQQQPVVDKPNNTGLPDNLKSGIEHLSGMSMGNVKVHYNSSQPARFNALAYAQDSNIHLGPGQEKHLPHEAWHVVQQKQGRVKPTMQMKGGVGINDDVDLEYEADVMGTKAIQEKNVSDDPASGDLSILKDSDPFNDVPAGDSVIQRNIGLEIEIPNWIALDETYHPILGEHAVLAKKDKFELQSELSGRLEFVTDAPGAKDNEELTTVLGKIKAFSNQALIGSEDNPIPTNGFTGNDVPGFIRKGERFEGQFQATVGIHLSALEEFINRADECGCQVTNKKLIKSEKESEITEGEELREDASPQMRGLLALINHYLMEGYGKGAIPLLKGLPKIMAQTDFAKMYELTPEFRENLMSEDNWVDFVLKGSSLDPDGKLFNQTIYPRSPVEVEEEPETYCCGLFSSPVAVEERYKVGSRQDEAQTVNLTRREWLVSMMKGTVHGADLATKTGSGNPLFKTMGSLHAKTDIGKKKNGGEEDLVIVELRNITDSPGIEAWDALVKKISDLVNELNRKALGYDED